MKDIETSIEETIGYKIAISFKPFIDPKCTEHIEIVKDMANSINSGFISVITSREIVIKKRVRQLLSALVYEKLTDYTSHVVLLLEKDLANL